MIKAPCLMTDSEFRRGLGRRVQEARRRAGLTQTELGRAIALCRASVANIEGGRQRATPFTLYLVAHHLRVDPTWLIVGTIPRPSVVDQLVDAAAEAGLLRRVRR